MARVKMVVKGSGSKYRTPGPKGLRVHSGGMVVIKAKKKKRKRKKSRRHLRPLEKATRRLADGAAAYYSEYGKRHRKSSRKKRHGWLKESGRNHRKALKKAERKAKVRRRDRWF